LALESTPEGRLMIHGTSSLPKSSEEFVKKYSIPAHFAEVSEVEELLRPLGLHRQRARLLKQAAEFLCREYGCRVPDLYGIAQTPGGLFKMLSTPSLTKSQVIRSSRACVTWRAALK